MNQNTNQNTKKWIVRAVLAVLILIALVSLCTFAYVVVTAFAFFAGWL